MKFIESIRPAPLALLAALFAAPASAQTPHTLGAGAAFETYELLEPYAAGVRRVSLMSAPFGASVQVMRRFTLQVSGAYASGSLTTADESTIELSGPTDTEVRVGATLGRDLLNVSVGYMVPTGRSTHSIDQAGLAGVIASDLLPFRVSNWGSGGALGISTAIAVPWNGFGVGISAGYTAGQEYEPLEENAFSYQPGNEMHVRAAIDRATGAGGKATLMLNVNRYADDAVNGENVFRPGNRLEAIGSYSFPLGLGASAVAYAGVQHRAPGDFRLAPQTSPAQDLILAGTGMRVPLRAGVLLPALDLRVYRRDDGLSQGYLMGIGATAELPAGRVVLVPTARTRFGKLVLWRGEETSVRGLELALTLRHERGRP